MIGVCLASPRASFASGVLEIVHDHHLAVHHHPVSGKGACEKVDTRPVGTDVDAGATSRTDHGRMGHDEIGLVQWDELGAGILGIPGLFDGGRSSFFPELWVVRSPGVASDQRCLHIARSCVDRRCPLGALIRTRDSTSGADPFHPALSRRRLRSCQEITESFHRLRARAVCRRMA